jgi:hypothetical protein
VNDRLSLPAGLSIDASGQAHVDKQLGDVLFDLALLLEDSVSQPVDIEHVLAAIVLAAQEGQINSQTQLVTCNQELLVILRHQLQCLFARYGKTFGDQDD